MDMYSRDDQSERSKLRRDRTDPTNRLAPIVLIAKMTRGPDIIIIYTGGFSNPSVLSRPCPHVTCKDVTCKAISLQ